MSLQRPPKELARFVETSALHCALNDMVQAYGQQCREQALLEAADIADAACHAESTEFANGFNRAAINIEKQIRCLK